MDLTLSEAEAQALALSFRVAVLAVAGSLPFGIGVAYLLARKRFVGHGLLNAVVHLPLVLPPVVTGYLLLLTFGRNGTVGGLLDACCGVTFAFRWTGAALAAGIMAFPLMVRAIRLSLEAVDPGLEEAAATLGASPVRVFLTVTLPLVLPGILAGTILAFAKATGEFGATITFVSNIPGETQTLSLAVWSALQAPGGEAAATRLAVLSIGLALGALLISEWLSRAIAKRVAGR